jgi:iron(III) transport system substrate-binding protein
VGTYDIARSALGLFFLARDEEHFPDIWQLLAAMRAQRLEAYPTSLEVIERVADGRLALGYNILIPYAAAEAERRPDLGLILPRDYTVVFSRVALVPRAAARPDLGEAFLQFLMSPAGQELMASRLRLPAVSPEVEGGDSAATLTARMGERLRPVSVSPGLLAYLDQAKRRRLLARWAEVAGRQVPDSLAP